MFQAWMGSIQCQICHMMFNDQSAISAHYGTAHAQSGGRPDHPDARHACEVCGKKVTTKHSLKQHMANTHGIGDVMTFQCDICSKAFNQKSSLLRHLRLKHKLP